MAETQQTNQSQSANQPPQVEDFTGEILRIIRSGEKITEIRRQLKEFHSKDIAAVFPELEPEERKRLYRTLDQEKLSEVFSYLSGNVSTYLDEMSASKAADLIEQMDSDDAVDVLDELPESKSQKIQSLMENEARADIELIHSYSDDQIGSRMTTNFVVIRKDLTVKEALHSLVDQAAENDNITTLFVVDGNDEYSGIIALNDLITASQRKTDLDELIVTSYPFVYDTQTVPDVIDRLKGYSEDSIPVLNSDNHVIGAITAWDVVEAVDEEMGEDYAKLGGLTGEEDLNEPLKLSLRKRLPWLVILLFLGLVVSWVSSLFEPMLAKLAIVASFQSVILGMAGNAGTQSLGVTIRVLMDENVTRKQQLELVWKETRVGFVNGSLLGAVSFVLTGLYVWLGMHYTPHFAFAFSGCIGISLMLSMMISALMGTLIPIFFKKAGVDPAVASGPLISTVNDLTGVVFYYGLSWILLLNVLHLA